MNFHRHVEHLSSGTLGDAIPAEVYEAGALPMADKLTESKDASIIRLYKRKGSPQVCDNHRGISLISGKMGSNRAVLWHQHCPA